MDEFIQADFLVVSAGLRVIYQKVSATVNTEELHHIVAGLSDVLRTLKLFTQRAASEPQEGHASVMMGEVFVDILALAWQITWHLTQHQAIPNTEVLLRELQEVQSQLRIIREHAVHEQEKIVKQ